jgi:hypothetical protein
MVSFPLTVLPSGMDLPTYYSYSRTAPGELWMYARGGGNGAILLSGQRKKIYFTTNGRHVVMQGKKWDRSDFLL